MTYESTDSAPHRLCTVCQSAKPIEDFRRRHRDRPARLSQCRECHNEAERLRQSFRRERVGRREMAKALTALKNQQSDAQVRAICGEMARRFGGTAGFLDAWQRTLDKDLAKGGIAALRHLSAILRLTQYCEQNKPNYGAMSDEELEVAILALGGSLPD